MKTPTENEMHRRTIALQFGAPVSSTTTMATLAYVALLTLGVMLFVGATMTVIGDLSPGTGGLLAASAVGLGAGLALLRPRLRAAF